MAKIVGVHGIAQQVKGPEVVKKDWLPALRDGLTLADGPPINDDDVSIAFYGDLFRPSGKKAGPLPAFEASDVKDEFELELLALWWREAAEQDVRVTAPGARTKARTPALAQRALNALSRSSFFAGLAERALIWDLRQVRLYLNDAGLRTKIQERMAKAVGADTRVIVAHSLGSVAAYEALCAHPEWRVKTLVTLGSPLGISNLVFHRLQPAPVNGIGAFPPVENWTNICDRGDVVALIKEISKLFGGRGQDVIVHNGSKAHDISPYLTARETGFAIATGLN
ncbi:MAG TPA: hypothetical protein VNA69_14475 [Thermoanaerobaculia bacterium]|nr:hypothetical protein [Thermoanaerobaculia bacterium]